MYTFLYFSDVRLSLLQQTHWMPIIKREYLESITIDQFRAFYTQFKSHIFTEGYVHGNFTPEVSCVYLPSVPKFSCLKIENFRIESTCNLWCLWTLMPVEQDANDLYFRKLQIWSNIYSGNWNHLHCLTTVFARCVTMKTCSGKIVVKTRRIGNFATWRYYNIGLWLQRRIVELPIGEHICRVQSVNLADCNSVITNYYQFGPANMYQDVIDDLMVVSKIWIRFHYANHYV